MAQAFGADVHGAATASGARPPDPARRRRGEADETLRAGRRRALARRRPATVTDIQAIGERTRGRSCLLAIDAVSSLGAVPLETDAWGLDVVVSGTQKGMSTPPGLSFASVSPRPGSAAARPTTPRFYFDWKRTLDAQNGGGSPFTPATATVQRARRRARHASSRRASRRSGSARAALGGPIPRAGARRRASSCTRPTTRRARS